MSLYLVLICPLLFSVLLLDEPLLSPKSSPFGFHDTNLPPFFLDSSPILSKSLPLIAPCIYVYISMYMYIYLRMLYACINTHHTYEGKPAIFFF